MSDIMLVIGQLVNQRKEGFRKSFSPLPEPALNEVKGSGRGAGGEGAG